MMEYNKDKVDEMVLALLYLTSDAGDQYGPRVWKNHDWETLDRLYEKGFIGDPKSKARSVPISEEALELSRELFFKYFGIKEDAR